MKSSLRKVHNATRVRFVTASLKVTEPQAGVMYLVVTKLLRKCQKSVDVAIHIVTVINIIIIRKSKFFSCKGCFESFLLSFLP